jgi:RNA polymerase sigma factor (sigma-70 family)
MDRQPRRSVGVTSTLTLSRTASSARPALDFEALYRAARDDVFAYVATLLRDRAAAEDVTAHAFERAYRKQRSYKPSRGSERAWLFGIARNAALDELRRRKRTAALAADPADLESATP